MMLSVSWEPPDTVIGDQWNYGFSTVYSNNGTVVGWANISDNLHITLGSKKSGATPFTLGSTSEEVLNVMGTPSSIIGTQWHFFAFFLLCCFLSS